MKSVPRAGSWRSWRQSNKVAAKGAASYSAGMTVWQYAQPVASWGNHLATNGGNETIAWHRPDATLREKRSSRLTHPSRLMRE